MDNAAVYTNGDGDMIQTQRRREREYVNKVLAVLDDYDDWLSKTDICLLADEAGNASYLWGVIDALIAVGFVQLGFLENDQRFCMCHITPQGRAWRVDFEGWIPF